MLATLNKTIKSQIVVISVESPKICNVICTGLKSEDVTVQVVGRDTFQVTGRHTGGIERVGTWHVKERPNGIFVRKFQLPSNVKMNKINSYNSDGVLVVIVPKKKTLIQDIPISKL